MSPTELLSALNRAGAMLVMEAGQMRLRGATIGEELKAELKANREAVVAEWQRQQAEGLDRYCKVPEAGAALVNRELNLTAGQTQSVLAYVRRQPRPVHAWVMGRANDYHALGLPVEECESCACVDVVAWQRNTSGRLALAWLEGLDEAAAGIQEGIADSR